MNKIDDAKRIMESYESPIMKYAMKIEEMNREANYYESS